jgi:hypothetical protein
VFHDGSVLVGTFSPSAIRRLVIDAAGNITDTGESRGAFSPSNVYCAPDARSGIVVDNSDSIRSFRIPGLEPVYSADLTNYGGTTGVFAADGTKVYVRSYAGTLDAFGYDSDTGYLSEFPLFSRTVSPANGFDGIDQMALDHTGTKLYLPGPNHLEVFDAQTGAVLPELVTDQLPSPTGICFRSRGDRDRDGLSDDDEAARGTDANDSDSDGDGLLDGFEVRYGFNPLAGGEQIQDTDGDGVNNLGEQAARTNPIDSDTDNDGIPDGQEVHVTGTDPRDYDTDNDGWGDGIDNCPNRANSSQADVVHPNGIGDACEDPDADLAFDSSDNCPDTFNPSQANADGDAAGDACDPYPNNVLEARPIAAAFGLTGQPLTVTYRLVDHRTGELLDSLTRVRATLTASGSAVFGTVTSSGILLDGGGTNAARVEFVQGLVTLDVGDAAPQVVSLGGIDSEHNLLGFVGASVEFLVPAADADADGLTNADEIARGTNPRDADSDGDGLDDGAEVNTYGTDPLNPDTDGGGVRDGLEIHEGTNPLDPADDHPPELGMVLNVVSTALIIDSHAATGRETVSMGYGSGGDCVISLARLGFAADRSSGVWVLERRRPPHQLRGRTHLDLELRRGYAATVDSRTRCCQAPTAQRLRFPSSTSPLAWRSAPSLCHAPPLKCAPMAQSSSHRTEAASEGWSSTLPAT